MNPEHGNYNDNEQMEREEQAIGEPMDVLEQGNETDMRTVAEMSNEEQDHYKAVE